jgi:hypothetical protein
MVLCSDEKAVPLLERLELYTSNVSSWQSCSYETLTFEWLLVLV